MEQQTLLPEAPAQRRLPATEPRLIVRQRGADRERVVDLRGEKCSIGSSPRCQICLPASDARPLQCVVAFEDDVLVAIRWAAGALLNGREFSKAPLNSGDTLAIGGWQIVVDGLPFAGDDEESSVERAEAAVSALLADAIDDRPLAPVLETLDNELDAWKATNSEPDSRWSEPEPTPAQLTDATPTSSNFESWTDSSTPTTCESTTAATSDRVADAPEDGRAETDCVGTPAEMETRVSADFEPEPVADALPSRLDCTPSQTFADRLVQWLWTANYRARRRSRGLIAGVRAARFQADVLNADLAAMETELDLARAAYDSRTESDDRLQEAAAEERRIAEERVAPLVAEIAELRQQLDHEQAALAESTAQCERLHADLANSNSRDEQVVASLLAETVRAAELEAEHSQRRRELDELSQALEATRTELSNSLESLALRTAELERLQTEMVACREERDGLQAEFAQCQSERHGLQTQVAEARVACEGLQHEIDQCRADRDRFAELHQGEATRLAELVEWQRSVEAQRSSPSEACIACDGLQREMAECRVEQERLAELYQSEVARVAELEERLRHADADRSTDSESCLTCEELQLEIAQCRTERDRLEELYQGETARVAEFEERLRHAEECRSTTTDDAASADTRTPTTDETLSAGAPPETEWPQELGAAWPAAVDVKSSPPAEPWNEPSLDGEAYDTHRSDDSRDLDEFHQLTVWGTEDAQRPVGDEALGDDEQKSEGQLAAESFANEDVHANRDTEAKDDAYPLDEEFRSQAESIQDIETPVEFASESGEEHTPAAPFASEASLPTSAADVAPPEEFASTSFIEKYRHLLEEESLPHGAPSRRECALLDDEYLSPAKVETAAPDNDSDAALEAYMASMMTRVRGGVEPTHSISRASQAPVPTPWPAPAPIVEPIIDLTPLDLESLKLARRQSPPTDLAALRQIANVSARTAIASSQERRTYETALIKLGIAASFMFLSAFLMASAPQIGSWWFWGGAASAAVGIAAAVQVLWLERDRAASRKNGNGEAPTLPTLSPAIPTPAVQAIADENVTATVD